MFLRLLLLTAGLLSLLLAQAEPGVGAGGKDAANQSQSQSVEALAAGIEHEPPSAAFETTKALWEADRKDDAVFFFYLGLGSLAILTVHRVERLAARSATETLSPRGLGFGLGQSSIKRS